MKFLNDKLMSNLHSDFWPLFDDLRPECRVRRYAKRATAYRGAARAKLRFVWVWALIASRYVWSSDIRLVCARDPMIIISGQLFPLKLLQTDHYCVRTYIDKLHWLPALQAPALPNKKKYKLPIWLNVKCVFFCAKSSNTDKLARADSPIPVPHFKFLLIQYWPEPLPSIGIRIFLSLSIWLHV